MKFKKFTYDQRMAITGAWSERDRNAKADAIKVFIDWTEQDLGNIFNPVIPTSPWTRTRKKKEYREMASHARALRLGIERLPERERWQLSAMAGATVRSWGLPPMSGHAEASVADLALDVLARLSGIVERLIEEEDRPLQTGPDTSMEHGILVGMVFNYRKLIGPVAASPNGTFYKVMRAIADVVDVKLGPGTLKSVIDEYPPD